MVILLDKREGGAVRSSSAERGSASNSGILKRPAGHPDPAQARVDPGEGAGLGGLCSHGQHRAGEPPAHGLRGSRLPQHRRVLAQRHATMMIMGDTCTRACAFCNVRTGLPGALDAAEPALSPTPSRSWA